MTQNRRFKKRVRTRMAQTGESYSAAYLALRNLNLEETPMTEPFQLVTNQDFGFSIDLPSSWRDVGPDIYNSAFEVAPYLRKSGNIHAGIVNIFWDLQGQSTLRSLVDVGDTELFDLSVKGLTEEGIPEISTMDTELDGRETIRLDWAQPLGEIEDWASRSYFTKVRGKFICLNMGTSDRHGDAALFDHIASSFRVIEETVGIVLVRDASTPSSFVAEVLGSQFKYSKRKALQQSIRMNTQNESVVALVDHQDADQVIQSIAKLSQETGIRLSARISA